MGNIVLSPDQLRGRIDQIRNIFRSVLEPGPHYARIKGVNKPVLLKAGAEALVMYMCASPIYIVESRVERDDLIMYSMSVKLVHRESGIVLGTGIGSCNSREEKYLYFTENTQKKVPEAYWDTRDKRILAKEVEGKRTESSGSAYIARKKEGAWWIFHRVERDNHWTMQNTILKMAKKRALVDAALSTSGVSDMLDQDLEDIQANEAAGSGDDDLNKRGMDSAVIDNATVQQDDVPKAAWDLWMEILSFHGDGDVGKATDTLERVTSFKGRKGQVPGVRRLLDLKESRAGASLNTFRKEINGGSTRGKRSDNDGGVDSSIPDMSPADYGPDDVPPEYR